MSAFRKSNDLNDVFQFFGWQVQVRPAIWSPPTDVYETEDAYVVRVEIAGMREEDFEITLEGNYLLIQGQRPDTSERRAYHQMEIRFGRFASIVELPPAVDTQRVEAEYHNGFLFVTLPKARPNLLKIQE
ncbi:MAG: Hsp20/alpha crystallin family protein [Anaerolineales bacterium]